ncbi:MAG: hypothetical protein RQ743_09450 [Bacteroidales bacterium]|nr:hypothetical protein [Bacteroidales bacterium]
MVKAVNNTYPADITNLINQMQEGKYKHLQIFLSRDQSNLGLGFGQKYLVVNPDGFGLYELNCVDYNDGILQILFSNPATGNTAEINLDVKDEHPAYIFICWKNIRDMVYDEITNCCAGEDLLELDYE